MPVSRPVVQAIHGGSSYRPSDVSWRYASATSGGGGGDWSPASLANIVDYGVWDDLTRLRTASDGSGSAPATNDPIGWWRGQLDTLTFIQALGSGYKPYIGDDGIHFGPTSYRWLYAAYTRTENADVGLHVHFGHQLVHTRALGFGLSANEYEPVTGVLAESSATPRCRAHNKLGIPMVLGDATDDDAILFNRDGGVATGRANDGEFSSAINNGTLGSGTTNYVVIGDLLGGGDCYSRRWCVTSGPVTGDDADLLVAWLKE